MNSAKLIKEPSLDRPGAGLPLPELMIAKHIVFPLLYKTTSPSKAIQTFAEESETIIALVEKLRPTELTERRLIQRLTGLEDSSRNWSAAMALQHLIIVGDGIRQTIIELSTTGTSTRQPRGTADVKPDPEVDGDKIISDFKQMTNQFLESTKQIDVNAFPNSTFPHPWFGNLNARGWLTLSGMHQRIHRKQIEAIIARL